MKNKLKNQKYKIQNWAKSLFYLASFNFYGNIQKNFINIFICMELQLFVRQCYFCLWHYSEKSEYRDSPRLDLKKYYYAKFFNKLRFFNWLFWATFYKILEKNITDDSRTVTVIWFHRIQHTMISIFIHSNNSSNKIWINFNNSTYSIVCRFTRVHAVSHWLHCLVSIQKKKVFESKIYTWLL